MKTLKQTSPVSFSRIYSLGAMRGEVLVSNDDVAGPIDSSDEWIRQRTGIVTRTRAGRDTSLMDLAVGASKEAIEKAGINPSEINAVILATISFPYQTPSGASLLSELVGAHGAAAYDISAACAGYCYGIAQADSLIRSGAAKYVLVVGAEKLSDFISPTDRSISFLLGDGAGAAIVGPSDIIDEFAKQLGLPESVVVAKDIVETGNTSAASIPLAMHRLLAEGQVKSGGYALQIGFGAGLAYAAQVVELP